MIDIDIAGVVTLMSFMLVRLAVPVVLMILLSAGVQHFNPEVS